MTSQDLPPLDEVFRDGDHEYLVASAPSLMPLFIQRGGMWGDDILSVIIVFFLEMFSYVLARGLRRTYRVTVSRRDVSRRPYWWRLVLSEEFATQEEAELRQKEIAAYWDAMRFATAEPIKNRRRRTLAVSKPSESRSPD